MADEVSVGAPFDPLALIDASAPLDPDELPFPESGGDRSILVRVGGSTAGGYLFNVRARADGTYELVTYEGAPFCTLADRASVTAFINHSAGLRFDPVIWELVIETDRPKR